jgi:hypothetical protein
MAAALVGNDGSGSGGCSCGDNGGSRSGKGKGSGGGKGFGSGKGKGEGEGNCIGEGESEGIGKGGGGHGHDGGVVHSCRNPRNSPKFSGIRRNLGLNKKELRSFILGTSRKSGTDGKGMLKNTFLFCWNLFSLAKRLFSRGLVRHCL